MSASMRPLTCYVCGYLASYYHVDYPIILPPSLTKRRGRVVCLDVQACTERVMNPPPRQLLPGEAAISVAGTAPFQFPQGGEDFLRPMEGQP